MANLLDENLVPFAAGIRSLPGRPHVSTGYRFISKGSHGVILETVIVGARRYTSREALRRFVSRVTAVVNGAPQPHADASDRDQRVERELDDAGI